MIECCRPPSPCLARSADDHAGGWDDRRHDEFSPGRLIITLTFLVRGLGPIHFFGGRGFCTYGCPYGVLFGLFDRLAPGKIRAGEGCRRCGRRTAICTSNVRVHEQVKAYGMVVEPSETCRNSPEHGSRAARPAEVDGTFDT